jgi:hypothetical protein
MMVRVVQAVVEFAGDQPLEFHSYCPMDRWQEVLQKVGTGVARIEQQLAQGAQTVVVQADTVFAAIDLEECTSGARDARLSSARLALIISAAGAVGETVLGLPWLGIPAYVISLALILGKPLFERAKEIPSEPFKVDTLSGARMGDHTDKAKVLERVIVAPGPSVQRHWWGTVRPGTIGATGAACLSKERFRVRCEGWERVPLEMCESARHEICVWEPAALDPRETPFGPIPAGSGHEETFWVEYVGVLTEGAIRRAGPFG